MLLGSYFCIHEQACYFVPTRFRNRVSGCFGYVYMVLPLYSLSVQPLLTATLFGGCVQCTRYQWLTSNLAPRERPMWWWGFLTPLLRSIVRRRKARPGTTTSHVKFNKTIRDRNSFRQTERRGWKSFNIARHFWSFSSGRRASWRTESSVIPVNCKTVAAPTVFWAPKEHQDNYTSK